jgi:hypothetical protein
VKTFPKIAAAMILVAGGIAAAVLATAKPATAWDIGALPAGYTVGVLSKLDAPRGECRDFYVVSWYGQSVAIGYGPRVGENPGSTCNPLFQQQLDAFVDATCCTPPTTTAAPPETTTAPTTTTAATTTAVPTTTTSPPVTVTTTDTVTAPATTVTTTVSTTTTPTATTDITAELAKLQAEIDALSARVTVLETKSGLVAVGPAPSGYAPSGIAYQT